MGKSVNLPVQLSLSQMLHVWIILLHERWKMATWTRGNVGTLPPTIMEVENYPLAKETHLGGSMIMEGRGNLPYMGTSGFQKTTTVSVVHGRARKGRVRKGRGRLARKTQRQGWRCHNHLPPRRTRLSHFRRLPSSWLYCWTFMFTKSVNFLQSLVFYL